MRALGLGFRRLVCLVAVMGAGVVGCGAPTADFRSYETYALKKTVEGDSEAKKPAAGWQDQVDVALVALFGTPDEPRLPPPGESADESVDKLIDINLLKLSAGPVRSDESGKQMGLFREHCAHCHGITGDGAGPTAAFLNPYPRDYRRGVYKFKSTPISTRATHEDLKTVIVNGIPGTSMPSFKLLSDVEIESLVHYVKYLSVRGETERKLYDIVAEDEEAIKISGTDVSADAMGIINGAAQEVVGIWLSAKGKELPVTKRPEMTPDELVESTKRGRTLFYGALANCFSCHGPSALGDGQVNDYDLWTKEFIGDGKNPSLVSLYKSAGLLEPRNIRPRNLRMGVYRGGMRPLDVYWRIVNGIEGSPMPGNAKLTPEQVWDIVNYVQSLPYETMSDPRQQEPESSRETF